MWMCFLFFSFFSPANTMQSELKEGEDALICWGRADEKLCSAVSFSSSLLLEKKNDLDTLDDIFRNA